MCAVDSECSVQCAMCSALSTERWVMRLGCGLCYIYHDHTRPSSRVSLKISDCSAGPAVPNRHIAIEVPTEQPGSMTPVAGKGCRGVGATTRTSVLRQGPTAEERTTIRRLAQEEGERYRKRGRKPDSTRIRRCKVD